MDWLVDRMPAYHLWEPRVDSESPKPARAVQFSSQENGKEPTMVEAMIKGKRIEIHNLDDLLSVVKSSRQAHESLVLFGDHDVRLEFSPTAELTDDQKREILLSTKGSWKGLVDPEQLKRDIYESRGQADRAWMVPESSDDQE